MQSSFRCRSNFGGFNETPTTINIMAPLIEVVFAGHLMLPSTTGGPTDRTIFSEAVDTQNSIRGVEEDQKTLKFKGGWRRKSENERKIYLKHENP